MYSDPPSPLRKNIRQSERFYYRPQRRKFAELLVKGKIKPEVYERWNRGAGSKDLPEHVKKKRPKGRKRRTKRRS